MLQQQSHTEVVCGLQSLLQTCKKLLTDRNQEENQALQLVHPKAKWINISRLSFPILES